MVNYLEENWIRIVVSLLFSWLFIVGLWFLSTSFFGILSLLVLAVLIYNLFDAGFNLGYRHNLGIMQNLHYFIMSIFALLLNVVILYGLVNYG